MSKYVIKQNTMYIRGVRVDDHTIHTEVSEAGREPFIIKQKPQEIMNQSCRFYGEHFNERKLFTKRLTRITSKPPILVSAVTSTYFFCTGSERSIDNTWINILYVKDFKEYNGNKTKIFLEQDQSLVFPISYHVINHQYLNCLCLYYRNHRNNIFIKQLNTPNIDLTQDGYSVRDAIKMYLKNQY